MDQRGQLAQIAALQARLKAWGAQLDRLQMQATNLNSLAPAIASLEQTRSIQQENYHNLATKLESSHVDEALDTVKTPNIKWVQRRRRLLKTGKKPRSSWPDWPLAACWPDSSGRS